MERDDAAQRLFLVSSRCDDSESDNSSDGGSDGRHDSEHALGERPAQSSNYTGLSVVEPGEENRIDWVGVRRQVGTSIVGLPGTTASPLSMKSTSVIVDVERKEFEEQVQLSSSIVRMSTFPLVSRAREEGFTEVPFGSVRRTVSTCTPLSHSLVSLKPVGQILYSPRTSQLGTSQLSQSSSGFARGGFTLKCRQKTDTTCNATSSHSPPSYSSVDVDTGGGYYTGSPHSGSEMSYPSTCVDEMQRRQSSTLVSGSQHLVAMNVEKGGSFATYDGDNDDVQGGARRRQSIQGSRNIPEAYSCSSPIMRGSGASRKGSFLSSGKTLRTAMGCFCALNAALLFLFSWMLRGRHISFALAVFAHGWDPDVKAKACAWAGLYYSLFCIVCSADGVWARARRVLEGLVVMASRLKFCYMRLRRGSETHRSRDGALRRHRRSLAYSVVAAHASGRLAALDVRSRLPRIGSPSLVADHSASEGSRTAMRIRAFGRRIRDLFSRRHDFEQENVQIL